jgi:hypothetical protein
MEIWRCINNYPNYEISTNGRVRNKKTFRILKQVLKKSGYYQVCLYNNGKGKIFYVHRLVVSHFLPNFYNKPTVDHKNRISTDNRLINLRWATHKEQIINTSTFKNGHIYKVNRKSPYRLCWYENAKRKSKCFSTQIEAELFRSKIM